MIIDAFAGNIFKLVDNVSSNQKVESVQSLLALVSTPRSNIILQSVGNSLVLRDRAAVTRPVTVVRLADSLNLSSTPSKGPAIQSVTSTFFFYQQINNKGFHSAGNTLSLSQSVQGYVSHDVDHLLTLTQSVTLNKVLHFATADTVSLISQEAVFSDNSCTCSHGDDPILFNRNPYFAHGNLRVVLRGPEFNNVERISQNRIMRRSRAGDLIIFRDNQWPATETLRMDFAYLTQQTAWQLVDFMSQTMGLVVQFFDNEQRLWNGFIMTPAAQVAEQLRNCFTVTLEFQGRQVPLRVEAMQQRLTLAQTVNVKHVIPVAVSQALTFSASAQGGYAGTITQDDDVGFALVTSNATSVANVTNDGVQLIHIVCDNHHYQGTFLSFAGPDPTTQFVPLKRPSEDPVVFTFNADCFWYIVE